MEEVSLLDIDKAIVQFNPEAIFSLNLILALVMFGISLDIKISDFIPTLKKPKALLVGLTSQLILLPLFSFLFVCLVQPHPSFALGLILVAACPGGNVSNYFTLLAKGNVTLSITLTVIASMVALFFTPFNFTFYASNYAPASGLLEEISLDPLALGKKIAIIILIPVSLGMFIQHRYTEFANKLHGILKHVSMILLLGIIVGAIYVNRNIFYDYMGVFFFLVLAHNFLALSLGWLAAKVTGLAIKERRTISLETGLQNSGLGLVIIFSFFDGLGGMAMIVGWWGVWHIISGFLFSWILTRNELK